MAEASGVRVGFIHYLLMLLVALTIVLGVKVVGSVLVTALLVLPGATALLVSGRLRGVVTASVVVGLAGAVAGLAVNGRWPALPTGPAIVLALFVQFVLAFVWAKARGR
jgi:ABC-type Mn2+/Zn2+ transport system permease subunit